MNDSQDMHDKLAAVSIFSGLSRRQLSKLAGKAKQTQHQPGHTIAAEGEGALSFHLVLSGEAEVTVHGKPVRQLKAGDYFGEISMIDGKKRSATVTATSQLSTLAVPHFAFQQLVEEEPECALGLLKLLCARLREAEAK